MPVGYRFAVGSRIPYLSISVIASIRHRGAAGKTAASRRTLSYSARSHLRDFASTPPETDHPPRNSALISLVKTIKPSSTTKLLPRFNAFLHPRMLRLPNRRSTISKCEMRICNSTHSSICKVARQDEDQQCMFQITRPTSVKLPQYCDPTKLAYPLM